MFGISALGWGHTLGSPPAIPLAVYMFVRHGRIVPRSRQGLAYPLFMLVGAGSVFLISHTIAVVTLVLLLAGYGVGRLRALGRARIYLETILLGMTAFLLMLPTVTEVLRRVPDGHPFVTDLHSPVLVGAQVGLLGALIVGVAAQVLYLRRQAPLRGSAGALTPPPPPAAVKYPADRGLEPGFSLLSLYAVEPESDSNLICGARNLLTQLSV